jgi:hypothetical protein
MNKHQALASLHPTLKNILESELALGNKIAEVSTGWGGPDAILVILELPFKKSYSAKDVTYHEVNDPHYWKAEYHHAALKQSVACKF